jgi:phage-related protein
MEDHALKGIAFFVDDRGCEPVRDYLRRLPLRERIKAYSYLNQLFVSGHRLHRPVADYLCEGIYELRPGAHRFLYFFYERGYAVFVHALRKKLMRYPE